MVQYSPIFVIECYYQAWFWQFHTSVNYRYLTCTFPIIYISQGDSLGVFQGSFGWFWSFQAGYSKSSFRIANRYNKSNLTALIYKAIIEAYLGLNILLSKNPQFKHLYIPTINIIHAARMSRLNLKPIITKEASISKTYKVLDNIFLY